MFNLAQIRKAKALFMKMKLHKIVLPFRNIAGNTVNMGHLSEWINLHPVKGYNDFYQKNWDYNRRTILYSEVVKQENLKDEPICYWEFGVSGGTSFRWWLEHNIHQDSQFAGFDTFEGLPEEWGGFEKGAMAVALEQLNIHDPRAKFYKGLFQDTLLNFLHTNTCSFRKVIHIDSDLFSAAIFTLTQLYPYLKKGDIILFDEFAVPQHEFLAFKIFTESFYIQYDVIGAANNYLFVAIKLI